MRFCDFCAPFYTAKKTTTGIKGIMSQAAIAEFFMSTALGEIAKIELIFGDDQFRKWFKGDREPTDDLWNKTAEVFDETRFSRTVSGKLNEKVLNQLLPAFDIQLKPGEVPDKFAFSAALAKQFGAITRGCGEADNIVNDIYRTYLSASDFPDYVRNSQGKYAKLKTLLYTSEERSFDEFFVCNTVSRIPGRFRRVPENAMIENVTLEELSKHARNVLLVGMGGIGKSMMMRHLFLSSIRQYSQSGILPIMVTLREFGAGNTDLFNVLVDSVHRFDITFSAAHVHKLMMAGKCQILLDGLDEIKSSDLDVFHRQLDAIIDRYPQNQYVMSTRRFSSFVELSRFMLMYILPFSNEQALELIDRLEYCPEEPKLKQQFRDKLESDYFKSHAEFVTNPLLLTLMLMSYHRFADVPEKQYLFYKQAYLTLLQRHDSDKLAYKRVFRSVTDPSDFTLVFREFCAKSYRKGDYEFDRNKFDDYFEKLKAVNRQDPNLMKADAFLFDACNSACLMYEEGQSYHFLHRSFQEYFFADYYSREDDTTLLKLGRYIRKSDQMLFDEGSAFQMLYDIAPDKVEHFIIMPFLAEIFDEGTAHEQYWKFLRDGYSDWIYTILDDDVVAKYSEKYNIRERYPRFRNGTETSSVILALILRIIGLEEHLVQEVSGDECKYPQFVIEKLYGEILHRDGTDVVLMPLYRIPKEFLKDEKTMEEHGINDKLVLDENGKPAELGCIYCFEFSCGLENPETCSALVELWEKDSCPAKKVFAHVQNYYEKLKEKFARNDELDDDDF
jgi:hypothetical protein